MKKFITILALSVPIFCTAQDKLTDMIKDANKDLPKGTRITVITDTTIEAVDTIWGTFLYADSLGNITSSIGIKVYHIVVDFDSTGGTPMLLSDHLVYEHDSTSDYIYKNLYELSTTNYITTAMAVKKMFKLDQDKYEIFIPKRMYQPLGAQDIFSTPSVISAPPILIKN